MTPPTKFACPARPWSMLLFWAGCSNTPWFQPAVAAGRAGSRVGRWVAERGEHDDLRDVRQTLEDSAQLHGLDASTFEIVPDLVEVVPVDEQLIGDRERGRGTAFRKTRIGGGGDPGTEPEDAP